MTYFNGLRVHEVVNLMVGQYGWDTVADEVVANKERQTEAEVGKLNQAIRNFGRAMNMPQGEIAKMLVKMPAASDPTQAMLKARPIPVDIGKVAAQTISAEGWNFVTQHYDRNLKDGHVAVNLVGQHRRRAKEQATLAGKKMNNMALLVAEPTNAADVNAVMVLMWDWYAKVWHHVGYVRADQAAKLRSTWPEDDVRKVQVASITDLPAKFDGHRDGKNLKLTISGEYRTYPAFQKLV